MISRVFVGQRLACEDVDRDALVRHAEVCEQQPNLVAVARAGVVVETHLRTLAECCEPSTQELALELAGRKVQRAVVRLRGRVVPLEPAQQVGPRRVEEVVVVEPLDRVGQGEPFLGP